jgi:hypothetical protein
MIFILFGMVGLALVLVLSRRGETPKPARLPIRIERQVERRRPTRRQ